MKASKFSDAQKAFIIKQGEEGTGARMKAWNGEQKHPLAMKSRLFLVIQIHPGPHVADVKSNFLTGAGTLPEQADSRRRK